MPYLACPACGLSAYAISRHSTDERCQRCGAPLRAGARAATSAPRRPALARRFRAHPAAARAARSAIDAIAPSLGADATETARLLVTELVGNSIRHSGLDGESSIGVKAFLGDDRALFQVHDEGYGFEPPEFAGNGGDCVPLEPGGRGLLLVNLLAARWGVSGTRGVTVWFELQLAPGALAAA
jgi:anti-sigma regulatory factor (Ser/Thr protein kinase)